MPPKKPRPLDAAPESADASMISNAPAPDGKSPKSAKKSDKDALGKKSDKEAPPKKKDDDVVALDDLLLPRSLISRLARGVLPPNTNLQKDAILAIAKSATVFISLLAAEANDLTDRKTIQPADVLKALKEIEFDTKPGFGPGERVERELAAYEESVKGKRKGYRDKVKARESAGKGEGEGEDAAERDGKRARLSEGDGDTAMGESALDESRVTLGDGTDIREEEDEQDSSEDDEDEGEGDEDEAENENGEDTLEMEGESSLQKSNVLAPDGRIEVGGSDEEDE